MKKLIILILLNSGLAFGVCISPIQRQNMSRPESVIYNRDFNILYERAIDLPGDCIKDGSLSGDQVLENEINGNKILNGTLTSNLFSPGVIPDFAKPLKVTYYTQNALWRKSLEVGMVLIQVVGGGGAAFHPGQSSSFTPSSSSSFGSHCTANGGGDASAYTPNSALGGTATGGDINIQGENGKRQVMWSSSIVSRVKGGRSFLGSFGLGGSVTAISVSTPTGSGGGGGYCAKVISRSELADEISVTVGKGGIANDPEGRTNQGKDGVVIVQEYGR